MGINLGQTSMKAVYLGQTAIKSVFFGSNQVWGGEQPAPTADWLCFTAQNPYNTIYLQKNGSPDDIYLEKSTDGTAWSDFNYSTTISLNAGEKLYIRAKSENQTIGSSSSNYYKFVTSNGKFVVSGNIQTLLKADGTRTDAPAYCYYRLFSASYITSAPSLPATALSNYCYYGMFQQCTALTSAPSLPATTLADYCYQNMFQGCTALTSAPALPATTLASNCYNSMFRGCSSLTTAPALPATTLASQCYSYMFDGCTSFTSAPSLPATTLVYSCYQNMFSNCTSLATAPSLPATTLADYCYWNIFQNCTSLATAPKLPATTLASGCYQSMFNGCTSLSSVEVAFTDWNKYGAVVSQNWLQNVAATGTFTCPAELSDIRDASHIPVDWQVVNPSNPLCFTAEEANSTVRLDKGSFDVSIETSTDGTTWTDYSWTNTTGNTISLANIGDKVYFRAKNENQTFSAGQYNYCKFVGTGKFAASGNIQSLLKADCSRTDVPDYGFVKLFYECSSLTTAPELPATTLGEYCYLSMFENCSLTTAPDLPATTLNYLSYANMFARCQTLVEAPVISATTFGSFSCQNMFERCTHLSSVNVVFTTWPGNSATQNWVYGVAASGTFTCPAALPDTRGSNNIPSGWTKVDAA